MFYELITKKRDEWYKKPGCPAKGLIQSIRKKGMMREPQIESIKTYLFLKLAGNNKSLSELFKSGFFCTIDLDSQPLPASQRGLYERNSAARSLYEYALLMDSKKSKKIKNSEKEKFYEAVSSITSGYDFNQIIDDMFYGVSYTDYIFSLPMGAGKTYLMAAFIYLDLYYALTSPEDKRFAHNFIVFAPSGLKSSIVPSLKTIEDFDPSWIFDKNTADNLKALIKFEVLDEQAGAKKSNRVRNPNAQKLALHQPFDELIGLVAVTNAEKVILEGYGGKDEDPDSVIGNELREIIGCIPNLTILIDEVHHASAAKKDSDEVKLRKVVEQWVKGNPENTGSITSVLGFSGTPYIEKPEKIDFGQKLTFSSSFLNNVVYYYPLAVAVETFLKKPRIETAAQSNTSRELIIEKGLKDFLNHYKDTVYPDGTCAKIAIYCAFVEDLEKIIYPQVCKIVEEFGLDPAEVVLKYHGGGKNNEYALPKENQIAFSRLDNKLSKIKVILLAQIGKEGWDCRSLTGVILSAAKSCPQNMVLQTCCRCLREVTKGGDEKALIWLSYDNAEILNKQLNKNFDTSIDELKALGSSNASKNKDKPIYNRQATIKLGKLIYFNMAISYPIYNTKQRNTATELNRLDIEKFKYKDVLIKQTSINNMSRSLKNKLVADNAAMENELITYTAWKHWIIKESLNAVSEEELAQRDVELHALFKLIADPIDEHNGIYKLKQDLNQAAIRSAVRKCFYPVRELQEHVFYEQRKNADGSYPDFAQAKEWFYPQDDSGLMTYYPDNDEVREILEADNGITASQKYQDLTAKMQDAITNNDSEQVKKLAALIAQANSNNSVLSNIKVRSHTFHYLPYRLNRSFEYELFAENLLIPVTSAGLDAIYNGDEKLGQLIIQSYTKQDGQWRRLSGYVPDFLILQRAQDGISVKKILIIETKGAGFDANFKVKRDFMPEFIKFNKDNHNPIEFDFLYLLDSKPMADNVAAVITRIKQFFGVDLNN